MKTTNEMRVGAVVIIALALAITGYFYFRGVGFGANLYYMQTEQATTISQGADVRLQGVKIGIVQDVSLDQSTQKPLLVLAVNRHSPSYELRKNYTYSITSASLLGEQYVDIRGPVTGDIAVYTPNDPSQIIAAKTSDLNTVKDDLTDSLQDLMKQLNVTLQRINGGVLSTENQKNLTVALKGLATMTQQASKSMGAGGFKVALGDAESAKALRASLQNGAAMTKTLNDTARLANQLLIRTNQHADSIFVNLDRASKETGNVMTSLNFLLNNSDLQKNLPKMFASLNDAAENVKVATAGLKKLSNDGTVDSIQQSLSSLNQSSAALRDATVSLRGLLTDVTLQSNFKSTFASLQQITATLEKTTANLNQASTGLNNVLGDAQLQADLKASAAELRKTLEATSGAAARVNHLLGGDKKSPATTDVKSENAPEENAQNRRGGLDFTYRYLDKEKNHHYGDLTLNTSLFGGPFRLGLSGIGEGNKLTLQTGNYLGEDNNLDVRYGVYRSKLGIGADYYWKRFSLEGNVWNPNNAAWNAYLGVQLSPQIEALIGRENNNGVHSTSLGVRLRR